MSDIRNYTFKNASGHLPLNLGPGESAFAYVLQDKPGASILDADFEVTLAEGYAPDGGFHNAPSSLSI